MKKLFACLVCFGLSALVAAGGATPSIEGAWRLTGGIYKGEKLPGEEIAKEMLVATFKDGKYTVVGKGKQLEAGTYKLDAKANPPTIDLLVTEGKDKDKKQVGIYKLEANQLTFAVSDSTERPKNFDGGKDIEVTAFKRDK
jgi:uncharacterized protein (TIGR03067 family)